MGGEVQREAQQGLEGCRGGDSHIIWDSHVTLLLPGECDEDKAGWLQRPCSHKHEHKDNHSPDGKPGGSEDCVAPHEPRRH